jgi:hypothetical protein
MHIKHQDNDSEKSCVAKNIDDHDVVVTNNVSMDDAVPAGTPSDVASSVVVGMRVCIRAAAAAAAAVVVVVIVVAQ